MASCKIKMREVENAIKYRRIPYPKRFIDIIFLLSVCCTLFLFFHANNLNRRIKELEEKVQPSGITASESIGGNQFNSQNGQKDNDMKTLQGTYQHLKNTDQRRPRNVEVHNPVVKNEQKDDEVHQRKRRSEKGTTHQSQEQNKDHINADDESYSEDEREHLEVDSKSNALRADLLNNTKKAEIDMVFFNRVPKVGSQSLMELMARLGQINGFVHARDPGKAHETILVKPQIQKNLIKDLISRPKPHIYSQHIAYINFTRFHMPKPIYINLIRHPIERIISWHYYVRAEWYYIDLKKKLGDKAPKMPPRKFLDMNLDTCVRTKDAHCVFEEGNPNHLDHRRQTLFFCGQNKKLCMPFNTEAAMQKAKRAVEEDYAVVGTWEDTNITLTVLEHYIPRYFRNAKFVYYLGKDRLSKVNKNPVRKPVSDLTREILAKNLTREIEFYEFCKQRLYLQYAAINEGKGIVNNDYLMIPEHQDDAKVEDY